MIKGTKLKTKDFVKMQLLRFRKCSPVKYDEMYQTMTPDDIPLNKGIYIDIQELSIRNLDLLKVLTMTTCRK